MEGDTKKKKKNFLSEVTHMTIVCNVCSKPTHKFLGAFPRYLMRSHWPFLLPSRISKTTLFTLPL